VARLLIVANKSEPITELRLSLTRKGYDCSILPYEKSLIDSVIENPPDLLLLEINKNASSSEIHELIQDIKQDKLTPVVMLIDTGASIPTNLYLKVDDFLVCPYSISELELRIQRILYRNNIIQNTGLFKYKDLVIDTAKCEVTVEGIVVKLTFKEYELLKFLAFGKGHVYTRETLLNKVWGYGYYGGDRTVDVHVRRLRSKIENTNHTFIETVRNIGYRFLTD